jgi:hypothetical protein
MQRLGVVMKLEPGNTREAGGVLNLTPLCDLPRYLPADAVTQAVLLLPHG